MNAVPRSTASVATATAAAPGGGWLVPLRGSWLDAAVEALATHSQVVRVTVTALRGSAPREPGASLLIEPQGTRGTIGGGRLEWHATELGRDLLSAGGAPVRMADWVLGPELGQCCGGRVELWLERLTRRELPALAQLARRVQASPALELVTDVAAGRIRRRLLPARSDSPVVALHRDRSGRLTLVEDLRSRRTPLWIFGAGHVGQALVRLLAELALFDIVWLDARPELLPRDVPRGVVPRHAPRPAEFADDVPAGARVVVLTHDHALDYEICRRLLGRDACTWVGLIGSASKAARFRSRLRRAAIAPHRLQSLRCPIGVPGMTSKLPAAIAIAIAAELLQQPADAPAATATHAAVPAAAVPASDCSAACGACGRERQPLP